MTLQQDIVSRRESGAGNLPLPAGVVHVDVARVGVVIRRACHVVAPNDPRTIVVLVEHGQLDVLAAIDEERPERLIAYYVGRNVVSRGLTLERIVHGVCAY